MAAIDEVTRLTKVHWAKVRPRVIAVEPKFAALVDELSLDNKFPLYIANYPYGATICDLETTFLPNNNYTYSKLNDSNLPKELINDLGYGADSAPLALVLDKTVESFVDLAQSQIVIPRFIYSPGSFFPIGRVLSSNNDRNYATNGILTIVSGVRSTFMLPNIGCIDNHANLQRDFNIQIPPAKQMYEHWHVFKEICNSRLFRNEWQSSVLYFSKKWIDSLHQDPTWHKLKLYLHEIAWKRYEFERNRNDYDIAFSTIQKKRNLKPNPYLADTARHLFSVAVGAAPGFAPACDETALPLTFLQKTFYESYGLNKYLITIMRPIIYSFENDSIPVYYSLQNPSTSMFSPKSRKSSSTLFEMRELSHITKIFKDEMSKDNSMCYGTVMNNAAKEVEFHYFHNKHDEHNIVHYTSELTNLDKRFIYTSENKSEIAKFAADAQFLRGCILIKNKKTVLNDNN